MIPQVLLLAWLYAAISLGAAISPPENSNLVPRKAAATFMTFPVPSCSSNGILETFTSDRCVRLSPRIQGLLVRQVTSGCRALAFATEGCSGRVTPLVVNQCYDMRNYVAFVIDC